MPQSTTLVKNPFFSLKRMPDGRLLMSVECGTTAVYDIHFFLDAEETSRWEKGGPAWVESMANKVMAFPDHFKDRACDPDA
jgi:hypothetical protein